MFKKLKLSAKIAALSAILFVFMAVLGIVGVVNMMSARGTSAYTAYETLPALQHATMINEFKGNVRLSMRTFTYTSNENDAATTMIWFDSLQSELQASKKFAETEGKSLRVFPKIVEKLIPEVKEIRGFCQDLFDVAFKQNERQKYLVSISTRIAPEILALSDEMIAQNIRGLNTSTGSDRASMNHLVYSIMDTRIKINRFFQRTDTLGAAEIARLGEEGKKDIDAVLNSRTVADEFKKKLADINKDYVAYFEGFNEYVNLQQERSVRYARQREQMGELDENVNEMLDKIFESNTSEAASAAMNLDRASVIMVILLIVAIILGIVMSVFIINSIVRPITTAIDELSSGSRQITGASGEISNASQSMASGASEQASSLEQISASLNEITAMTKQTADNARNANALVQDSVEKAKGSQDAMERLLGAVNEIKQSGDETAKILKDIDEIAFQTNLLALNAAVEAARAGEAGKGFAVVAEEVRNLAQRSAAAARKTAELIQVSQKSSLNGVEIAEETAKSIEKISEVSNKVAMIVTEITTAAEEQSRGVSQVNSAIGNLDQVTQSNASQSEELAASSEELSSQALSINDLVGDLVSVVAGEMARAARERGMTSVRRPVTGRYRAVSRSNTGRYRAITTGRMPAVRGAKAEKLIPFNDDKNFGNY